MKDTRRFAIYYRDREFAREQGDPILLVVHARTKEEAEIVALNAGVDSRGAGLWACEPEGLLKELLENAGVNDGE